MKRTYHYNSSLEHPWESKRRFVTRLELAHLNATVAVRPTAAEQFAVTVAGSRKSVRPVTVVLLDTTLRVSAPHLEAWNAGTDRVEITVDVPRANVVLDILDVCSSYDLGDLQAPVTMRGTDLTVTAAAVGTLDAHLRGTSTLDVMEARGPNFKLVAGGGVDANVRAGRVEEMHLHLSDDACATFGGTATVAALHADDSASIILDEVSGQWTKSGTAQNNVTVRHDRSPGGPCPGGQPSTVPPRRVLALPAATP